MNVASLLRNKPAEVRTVLPWVPVKTALPQFSGPPRVGALVVIAQSGVVAGLLSERDITRSLTDHGPRLLDMAVESVMSHNVPRCSSQDSLGTVMRVMTTSKFRHLLVVTDGELLGVISIGDVISARLRETELESSVLRDMVRSRE